MPTPRVALAATLAASTLFAAGFQALAQPTSRSPLAPPPNGPRKSDPTWIALADCTLHAAPSQTLLHTTIVFRDGVITAVLPPDVGSDGKPGTADDTPARTPLGPRIIDASGLHAYAAFIDPFVEVDAPAPPALKDGGTGGNASHWSPNVTPQRSALDGPGLPEGAANSLRELGYGAACITPKGGIFKGSSALVSLAKPSDDISNDRPPIYEASVYQSMSFQSLGGYPDSQMGSIALMRQTFMDALWAFGGATPRENLDPTFHCLSTLAPKALANHWLVMDTADELESLRAAKVIKEFQGEGGATKGLVLVGCGTEFARLQAIKEDACSFFLPLNFPKPPDVASPGKADSAELRDMMAWEQGPTNPRRLEDAGITFALTTAKLKGKGEFLPNLRKAIRYGLSEETALAALTTTPAKLLGAEQQLGTIDPGKRANILLSDRPIFAKDAKVRFVYVDGVEHEYNAPAATIEGTWDLAVPGAPQAQRWFSVGSDNTLTLHRNDNEVKATKVQVQEHTVTFIFDHDPLNAPPKPKETPKEAPKDAPKEGDKAAKPEAKPEAQAEAKPTEKPAEKPLEKAPEAQPKPETKPAAKPDANPAALPAGIHLMSGSIVRSAKGEATRIVGQGIRASGEAFAWSAIKRPPSLAGEWPIFFDAEDPAQQRGPVLRITDDFKDGSPVTTVAVVVFANDGKETVLPTRDATWDGKALHYTLSKDSLPGAEADVSVSATFTPADAKTQPPTRATLTGQTTSGGRTLPFTARKVDPKKWWVGTWNVIEFEGKRTTPADDTHVAIELEEGSGTAIFSATNKEDVRIKLDDFKVDGPTITFTHSLESIGGQGKSSDTLTRVAGELLGVAKDPGDKPHTYTLRQGDAAKPEDDDAQNIADTPETFGLPFGPFALDALPAQKTYILTHATVWTNTDKGKLADTTVVISGGKILAVGQVLDQLTTTDATTIDCTGMHISPGVIDCHSHTGISKGVNEGAQAVTSEVRIQDVTNPDDVNWYRQLAGGVTSVNQLHGSANAIGGQSQTTKLRWGVLRPDDMHFEGATPGIKFALGENPRSVNWDAQTTQYPRTRMGVEMVIRDRFSAAREYAQRAQGSRTDLELEPLAEILAGKRLLHCHSYRQDEIVMLAQVARDFGFKIGTYQHILEGYKVADYVRDYSGGGSGFTDWWAYKMEVQDAIPAGLPLMAKVGVTTSFNSDSNELARRLNTEAAKAVKYGRLVGGISEEDALKFVTLNPAKQLHVDNRVGTIEVGKDADLVVWTTSPLSTMTRAARTFIDGREYFSLETDQKLRDKNLAERGRLIQKLLRENKKKEATKNAGDSASPGDSAPRRRRRPPNETELESSDESLAANSTSETSSDESTNARAALSPQERAALRDLYLQALTSGKDPRFLPGVCGCCTPAAYTNN